MEAIPDYSFHECRNMQKVEFVATAGQGSTASTRSNPPVQPKITEIGFCAFSTCPKLHSVIGLEHVSCSLGRIGFGAFGCCGKLTTLELPCLTRVELLEGYAFSYCYSLTVVDLSNSVMLEAIRAYTFKRCKTMKVIRLPPNLKWIGCGALQECSALVSIVIPARVEFMAYRTFEACSSLMQVTLQSTRPLRTLMNDQQFFGCTSLHTLELQGPTISRKIWPHLLEQF
eukprot:CAMPEP_0168753552 /NCGR_PEP_ID=MMETSP0724-20121128/19001_1 /TAXON_ID=265536 /ORGANISM="Amphiprora sp., Strain CCMP467" /LENGTH=227 /DNA_ID=CAMNT_0008801917 /DNA_START=92 /DNA_END=772 /DNA_ORIENTATION=-